VTRQRQDRLLRSANVPYGDAAADAGPGCSAEVLEAVRQVRWMLTC